MGREVVGSVEWARENYTPEQMDVFGQLLYDTLVSYLAMMTSDIEFDKLIEYAVEVAGISQCIKTLNAYKVSACGKILSIKN